MNVYTATSHTKDTVTFAVHNNARRNVHDRLCVFAQGVVLIRNNFTFYTVSVDWIPRILEIFKEYNVQQV